MSRWLLAGAMMATSACERLSAREQPEIESVDPWFWEVDAPPTEPLTVYGQHFLVRVRTDATHDTVATNDDFDITVAGEAIHPVRWVDNGTLEAPLPNWLPVGVHPVRVLTPDGAHDELADAIEVLEPGTTPVGRRREGPAAIDENELETTVPIDPVDPSSSILFFNVTHTSHEPGTGLVIGWLANDGRSVTFARNSTELFDYPGEAANEAVSIRWTVLQLAGIRVLRDRTVLNADLDQYVTLPGSVNLSHSFVLATHNLDGGHFAGNDWVRARLEDDQTLRFSFLQAAEFGIVAWQVIEIADAIVESGDVYLTGGATSVSVPSMPVAALEHSLLFFTQNVHGSTHDADGASALVSGRLHSPTEILFERYVGWTEANVDISWFRVTWPSMAVQRGEMPFAPGELTKDVILTEVDPERSVGVFAGLMRQSMAEQSDDHVGAGWFTTELISRGARLQLTRGVADSRARAHWQVVEFQ